MLENSMAAYSMFCWKIALNLEFYPQYNYSLVVKVK